MFGRSPRVRVGIALVLIAIGILTILAGAVWQVGPNTFVNLALVFASSIALVPGGAFLAAGTIFRSRKTAGQGLERPE